MIMREKFKELDREEIYQILFEYDVYLMQLEDQEKRKTVMEFYDTDLTKRDY